MKARLICFLALCAGLVACANADATSDANFTATSKSVASPNELATPVPPWDAPGATRRECNGDTDLPTLSNGWNLLWQHVFAHPIARPPVVTDSQLILLERAVLFEGEHSDTILVMDPQTSAVLWQFEGLPDVTLPTRWIRESAWSPEYLALWIQYQANRALQMPEQYLVVLERPTGHIALSERIRALEMTMSDDAVYLREGGRGLARIDLPGGEYRWKTPQVGGFGGGLHISEPLLYAFQSDRNVYRYNSLDGALVATGTLGISPLLGNVLTRDHLAIARSEGEGVVLFDLQTHEPQWETEVDYLAGDGTNAFEGDISSMTMTSDALYLFNAQDQLLRISLLNGQIVWRAQSPGVRAMSRPVAAHGLIYGLFADGTLRAFAANDGSSAGIVMTVPLWYRVYTDTWEWRDLVGGLDVAGDTLIVTTGCRSVYAIQREN